jgi:hypothetical protein
LRVHRTSLGNIPPGTRKVVGDWWQSGGIYVRVGPTNTFDLFDQARAQRVPFKIEGGISAMTKIRIVAFALLLAAVSGQALAKSTFTLKNKSNDKVEIAIYNGDDSVCLIAGTIKDVDSGKTASFSCAGDECKVTVQVTAYEDTFACGENESNSAGCGARSVVIVPNGGTLTIPINYDSCIVKK